MQGRADLGGDYAASVDGFETVDGLVARYKRLQTEQQDHEEADRVGDLILNELASAGLELARRPADNIDQLLSKVKLWRALAPEEVIAPDEEPTDMQVLLSIMSDIERLLKQDGSEK